MSTVTIDEAQVNLPKLIEQLLPGEELTITSAGQPLARVKKTERKSWPCRPGSAKDVIRSISPDFDAPLDDFRDDME